MAKAPQDTNAFQEDALPQETQGSSKLARLLTPIKRVSASALARFNALPQKQKILFSGIGVGVVVILLSLGLMLAFSSKKQENLESSAQAQEKIQNEGAQKEEGDEEGEELSNEFLQSLPKVKTKLSKVTNQNLNALIQKANLLYKNGNQVEALNVFDKIATFSQSLASYNLGVMQAQQQDYKSALKSFESAINAGEDISLSAYNAAIAARYMGEMDMFRYYLDIASRDLPKANKKPFYSYLYALVNFYNQNYFAALSSIHNPTSKAYIAPSADISAKTFLVFGDDEHAIKALEAQEDSKKDFKNLGLLYARIGDFSQAEKYLVQYQKANPQDYEVLMALQVLYLKMRDFSNASSILNHLTTNKKVPKDINKVYPIKVVLQPKFFDVDIAQEEFVKSGLIANPTLTGRLLFYFAPYKVFDVQEALHILRESGIFSAYNVSASEDKLLKSQTLSKINKDVTQALIAIYRNDLRKALALLKEAAKNNPNHSVLHYDLALAYAQMDDLDNAYKHFVKSYYLDNKNIEAGLFAVLSAQILDKDAERIARDIAQDFDRVMQEDGSGDENRAKFLLAFMSYLNNGLADDMSWIDSASEKLPIYYAMQVVIALHNKDHKLAYSALDKLDGIYSNDLLIKTLKALYYNVEANFKQNALKLYNMIAKEDINLDSVYYGPAIARHLYAYIGFITGALQIQENKLQEKLTASLKDSNGILQALALVNIYQHKFDQAYSIYDTLVNTLGENDTRTQFLAAVALIGTGNYDNAALMLQLSKMSAETSFETKYVLGMLYQQEGNLKAAASHYSMIARKPFQSIFFDFEIDIEEILENQTKK